MNTDVCNHDKAMGALRVALLVTFSRGSRKCAACGTSVKVSELVRALQYALIVLLLMAYSMSYPYLTLLLIGTFGMGFAAMGATSLLIGFACGTFLMLLCNLVAICTLSQRGIDVLVSSDGTLR